MADFSCYVMVVNNTSQTMSLQGKPVDTHGEYISDPAASIAAGGSTTFHMEQDNSIAPGPVGSCNYSVTDQGGGTGVITFSYACPVTDDNAANAVVISGSPAVAIQMIPNPLPEFGHPVRVQFTISDN